MLSMLTKGQGFFSKDVIKQFEIDLNAQEGAKIEVKLDVKYANIRSVTGSNIQTSGIAKHQDISIYTGGVYEGKDLKNRVYRCFGTNCRRSTRSC